jgi:hypothetical protein
VTVTLLRERQAYYVRALERRRLARERVWREGCTTVV